METIKEEKKADLEQLLNSLIEKGWKPRGSEEWKWIPYTFNALKNNKKSQYQFLRNLTSKESWLWQFVCENGMIKTYMNIEHESRRHSEKNHKPVWAFDNQSYYYLIESALCDEDKLEDFILDNIKI